jgi:hypothetical protein
MVNSLPLINLNTDGSKQVVCSNLPYFFCNTNYEFKTDLTTLLRIGFKDNVLLQMRTTTPRCKSEGTYTVEVTVLGCSRIRTIKVTASDIASITSIDVVDLSDTSTVTVNARKNL